MNNVLSIGIEQGLADYHLRTQKGLLPVLLGQSAPFLCLSPMATLNYNGRGKFLQQRLYCTQSQNYLLSDPLQRQFDDA